MTPPESASGNETGSERQTALDGGDSERLLGPLRIVLRPIGSRKVLESWFDHTGPYRDGWTDHWIPDLAENALGHLGPLRVH